MDSIATADEPAGPPKITASICCYCGTGCGLRISSIGQRVLDIAGDPGHPSSLGKLCNKGRTLAQTVRQDSHSRVIRAQWRTGTSQPRRDSALEIAMHVGDGD